MFDRELRSLKIAEEELHNIFFRSLTYEGPNINYIVSEFQRLKNNYDCCLIAYANAVQNKKDDLIIKRMEFIKELNKKSLESENMRKNEIENLKRDLDSNSNDFGF